MPIAYTGLPVVLANFPEHQERIKRLFRRNETFQGICEDYGQCFQALKYWNRSDSREALARREEYKTLLQSLAEEILQKLNGS